MFDELIKQLQQDGLAVCPDFIHDDWLAQLRNGLLQQWQAAEFHQAGVGHGQGFELNGNIRNDYILWLEPENTTLNPAEQRYLALLEQLRLDLNREFMLGLFDYEAMLAVYPEGHYYQRHLDQFNDDDLRVLTTILYLNEDWQEQDGGQLRLYYGPQQNDYRDILPVGGTLVCFFSEQYPHEVLTTRRQRLSLTGWMRRRGTTPLV